MRYYKITFSGDTVPKTTATQSIYEFSSHTPNPFSSDQLLYNPGALDIEFDITVGYIHNLQTATHLRIYNPSLEMINKAPSYQGLNVIIEAGFKHGMPLANNLETKSGQIAYGVVQNCFANWMGTELALDFIVIPSPLFGNPDAALAFGNNINAPKNYLFQWLPKQTFYSAIVESLKPYGITVTGSIKEFYNTNNSTLTHSVSSFQALADFINAKSIDVVSPSTKSTSGYSAQKYSGVFMAFGKNGSEVVVSDNTSKTTTVNLQYEDFIGQPTFNTKQIALPSQSNQLVPAQMLSSHPMRADITLLNNVKYPINLPNQLIGTNPFQSNKPLIRGVDTMVATEIRHAGRFRDTSALGWATHLRCNWTTPEMT